MKLYECAWYNLLLCNYISTFIELFMKSLIRGNEKSKCGVPEVHFGYGGGVGGSEPVLGWYRFDWSVTVSVTGFADIFKFFIENFLKIVF